MKNSIKILGMPVNCTSYNEGVKYVLNMAKNKESKYVCFANVHMVMEYFDSELFRDTINNADLVAPDGMPLVWMLKIFGSKNQTRVRGPSFMIELLRECEKNGIKVGFFGGAQNVIDLLMQRVCCEFKNLDVVYSYSPPFRELSKIEDQVVCENINVSGAQVIFVGLGCPKQEMWMFNHKNKINSIMLGVGAAFDMYARVVPECPLWLQKIGLEWAFRLFKEPRRLWMRYFKHNPRFIGYAILQICGIKFHR